MGEVENVDREFLQITDLADMDMEFFTNAMEKFDLITFDAFQFEQFLSENSLQYLFYKIF